MQAREIKEHEFDPAKDVKLTIEFGAEISFIQVSGPGGTVRRPLAGWNTMQAWGDTAFLLYGRFVNELVKLVS